MLVLQGAVHVAASLLGTLFGVAVSLGLGSSQIAAGLDQLEHAASAQPMVDLINDSLGVVE